MLNQISMEKEKQIEKEISQDRVKGPISASADLRRHNADCKVEDFDYALIKEHLK